jgi:uncharacterized lipoprotein YddW (UPF0748 family)
MNSTQMKAYFTDLLDKLQAAGINAVIFQVRPSADAFYNSNIEPWSSFLTGTQGKGLPDGFDPLAFMVEESHKRGMELHAWLNPYRARVSDSQVLASNHLYYREPDRFIQYGTQLFFDPGIPKNRELICQVVNDIVSRYDVDAIHMDDYFYPYPIAGQPFPDDASFAKYGVAQGFPSDGRDDWRRNNVNMLIKEIKETILAVKPWVRFGVSPFGIYRNKKNTPGGTGSDTNGLQNYDDLYADIKLWVKNKWVDYNLPQLYWEIGHSAADYSVLVRWWAENNFEQPLYIGQDVERSMNVEQLEDKMRMERNLVTISGNCMWPGYDITNNYKGISDRLKSDYFKYHSLIPAYTHMSKHKPNKINKLQELYTATSHYMLWQSNKEAGDPQSALYFVIYRFAEGQKKDLADARCIVQITRESRYELPYEGGNKKYEYAVTAVDAYHNESKDKSIKVTL